MLGRMTIQRMDNIGIVVDDLEAATAFFTELGLVREAQAALEGAWVDRVLGLSGVRSDIVIMATPDGNGRVELMKYQTPAAIGPQPTNAPPNALGIRRLMFTVDDIDAAVARVQKRGAALVGEVAQVGDQVRLCFLRGPEGILVALKEQIG